MPNHTHMPGLHPQGRRNLAGVRPFEERSHDHATLPFRKSLQAANQPLPIERFDRRHRGFQRLLLLRQHDLPCAAAEHFFLGDIRELDGTPWECCVRAFLRRAIAALKAAIGG